MANFPKFLGYLSRDLGNIVSVISRLGFAMLEPKERREAEEALDAVRAAVANLARAADEVKDLKGVSLSAKDFASPEFKATLASIVAEQIAEAVADMRDKTRKEIEAAAKK